MGRYYIETKDAFDDYYDISGLAEDYLRDAKVYDYSVSSDNKNGLERLRRALKSLGYDSTPVMQYSGREEKNFYSGEKMAAKLPSEEDGGKPSHDEDFKAGFEAAKKVIPESMDTEEIYKAHSAGKRYYGRISNKFGSSWMVGWNAAFSMAQGLYGNKSYQIAKKMGLKIAQGANMQKRNRLTRNSSINVIAEIDRLERQISAGCEKLPAGGMRENCEKKVSEGEKDDSKKKESSRKTARLMGRQQSLLDRWAQSSEGQRTLSKGYASYDDLPSGLRSALEQIKDQETLWSDVERYLGDLAPNPHMRGMWGSDREAGCEKLPAGGMRENCEKKVSEGEKDDSKDDDKKEASRDTDITPFEMALEKAIENAVRDAKRNGETLSVGNLMQMVRPPSNMLIGAPKGTNARYYYNEMFRDIASKWYLGRGIGAGCEKLPEGGMRDNCEKKVSEGKKNDSKKKESSRKTANGSGNFSGDLTDIIEGYASPRYKNKSIDEIIQIIKKDKELVVMMKEERMSDSDLYSIIEESRRMYSRYAGCEKLPAGGMRENCEKKVSEGEKNDSKKKESSDSEKELTEWKKELTEGEKEKVASALLKCANLLLADEDKDDDDWTTDEKTASRRLRRSR